MSSAARRFYIILFLIVGLEEKKKNLLSNQSFWPHGTNTLMIPDSLFSFFLFFLYLFFFSFAHVPEHVRKHYNTVCSGGGWVGGWGMLKRSAPPPPAPSPRCPPHMTRPGLYRILDTFLEHMLRSKQPAQPHIYHRWASALPNVASCRLKAIMLETLQGRDTVYLARHV